MADDTFYRCAHCKGFYETDLPECKYCRYKSIVCGADGKPRLFPDRETCRAIQIAEYEQLPAYAMDDPFKPPKDELAEICGCLHCGPDGPPFEAIEMRWIVNEQMWACPCTTCGGRGFSFDIHPLNPHWECAECRHKWRPADGNYKYSNCKCPKCGCTEASGMFQDEHSWEEIEAMTDEQYAEAFGITRAEEELEAKESHEKWEREKQARKEAGIPDDPLPWEDPLPAAPVEDFTRYDPEARTGEVNEDDDDDAPQFPERLRDDIDFPHVKSDQDRPPIKDDDIPF